MATAKIFWVMIGFFIISLLMWGGKIFVEKVMEEASSGANIENEKKQILALKLKILHLDLDLVETVASRLGILASIAGIISLAWKM